MRFGYFTITKDQKGKLACVLLKEGANKITLEIRAESVQLYLAENELSEVVITASMEEGDGGLKFVFGPSGLYFNAGGPAVLTLQGELAKKDAILTSEDGEVLEATKECGNGKIVFFNPPFFQLLLRRV